MPNYANSKIYKLVSSSGKIYVGSTTQSLAVRKAEHKSKHKSWKSGAYPFVTSFILYDEDDVNNIDIVLILECPCDNKEQLYSYERKYIEETDCVNKIIPARTKAETRRAHYDKNIENIKKCHKKYYIENIELIRERCKQYRLNNADAEQARNRLYRLNNKELISMKILCKCGSSISKSNLSYHLKSNKHLEYVNLLNTKTELDKLEADFNNI